MGREEAYVLSGTDARNVGAEVRLDMCPIQSFRWGSLPTLGWQHHCGISRQISRCEPLAHP